MKATRADAALAALAGCLAVALSAEAKPAPPPKPSPKSEPPAAALCPGCIFVPAKGEHRPLVVLLHGDRQPPRRMVRAFRAAAAKADVDVALLAPPCPAELGCDQRSFWRWGGDPAWLSDLAARAVERHGLDEDRVSLVGWSGGATYLGKRMAQLGDHYSAAVFLGGGVPGPECAARPIPVFLVQGDRNPMHATTVALRQRLEECHHDVQWHLLRGADHAAEWDAVSRSQLQRQLFEFLLAHARPRAAEADTAPDTSHL